MKPIPLLVGGLVTAALAWFLLPRPSTDPPAPAATPEAPGPSSSPPTSARDPGVPPRQRPRHLPRSPRAPAPAAASGATPEPTASPPREDTAAPVRDVPIYTADARGFRRAMRDRMPALRECYQGWLAQDPGLAGEIVVRFTLEPPSGGRSESQVDGVELLDSSLDHAFMEGCVLSSLEDLRFEPLDSMKVFTYPLRFSADGPDK